MIFSARFRNSLRTDRHQAFTRSQIMVISSRSRAASRSSLRGWPRTSAATDSRSRAASRPVAAWPVGARASGSEPQRGYCHARAGYRHVRPQQQPVRRDWVRGRKEHRGAASERRDLIRLASCCGAATERRDLIRVAWRCGAASERRDLIRVASCCVAPANAPRDFIHEPRDRDLCAKQFVFWLMVASRDACRHSLRRRAAWGAIRDAEGYAAARRALVTIKTPNPKTGWHTEGRY